MVEEECLRTSSVRDQEGTAGGVSEVLGEEQGSEESYQMHGCVQGPTKQGSQEDNPN